MNDTYPITLLTEPTEQDHAVIFNGINAYACSQGGAATAGSYFFAVYDAKNKKESFNAPICSICY